MIRVTSSPKGYRDVYWCWILNEPVILTRVQGVLHCDNCHLEVHDHEKDHTFICHIEKGKDKNE